jgi:low temperature requirement protein LtrA
VRVTETAHEKRVTWAELFFDLVFVVGVTRTSELVAADHSAGGLLRALVVLVPLYWLWVGTAVQTNLQDAERAAMQLRIFAIALAAVFMALALPAAYDDLGMVFAVAYWAGRIVLGAELTWRMRSLASPWGISMVLTGPLLVLGATMHGSARTAVWAVAALLDLSTPTLLKTRLRRLRMDPGHLAERFGLFVLIALGESVVAVVTSTPAGEITRPQGFAVAAAFVLCAALWWVYFHFAADAMRHALATARVQLDVTRFVLSYGHLAFIAAIIVVAVGLHETIAEPSHQMSATVAGLLYGGTAAYLATFGFTRWAMFHQVSWTRLTAATVVLALLPLATQIGALAALCVLAAVVVVLNAVELRIVQRRAAS